jgi:hypothetical protein
MLAPFDVGSEGFNEAVLPLRHEDGLAVGAAEDEVARLLGLELDLALDVPVRCRGRIAS